MTNSMMDGGMMGGWIMGGGILVFVVLLLGAAALVKYLFFAGRRDV